MCCGSREERAEVAHKLLLSPEGGAEAPGAHGEWSAEVERRAREVLDGSVKTVAWEQAEERIRNCGRATRSWQALSLPLGC
jgi:putative addiction module component (TIGR02574 family)